MKKSVPISDDLNVFFTDPCPVLSDNNSQFILDEISKGYDWVVEYGMGASTLYFLQEAEKLNCKMISVENNFDWFEICIQKIMKLGQLGEVSFKHKPWSLRDIDEFIKGHSKHEPPDELKRFPNWKDLLATGPFFRFSPNANSRFKGKLGPFWPALKPLFKLAAKIYFAAKPGARPQNGEWRGKKGTFELILRNVGPSIKDQFGEAPNISDYIDAGLDDIRQELDAGQTVSALIVIDGGPRHIIVQTILNLEDQYAKFKPTIILCDACRAFYKDTLDQRSSGIFMTGSNKTLKGEQVVYDVSGPHSKFWAGDDKTAEELAQKEIWVYSSER